MWIKDGNVFKSSIVLNGTRIYNPTTDELVAAGYTWSDPIPDPHDWVDKELFINAAYQLIPSEVIPAVLADADTAKAAVTGMTLLSTNAAPGNLIDVADERVVQWLAVGGVTVGAIKAKIEEFMSHEV